jgi:hypothetical protein
MAYKDPDERRTRARQFMRRWRARNPELNRERDRLASARYRARKHALNSAVCSRSD